MSTTKVKGFWKCRIVDNQAEESAEWAVEDEAVQQKILAHCRNASPYTQTFAIHEREGYNGVQFFDQQEKYAAFMAEMTHEFDGKTEIVTDLGRKLEKLVLMNAPEPYRAKALFILAVDFD